MKGWELLEMAGKTMSKDGSCARALKMQVPTLSLLALAAAGARVVGA